MYKKLFYIIPFVTFVILAVYFYARLELKTPQLKSMLIGLAVPKFELAPIQGRDKKGFKHSDLIGNVSLVNIFGSWCAACLQEHPFLIKLKNTNFIPIHGIDWRETERFSGPEWLKRHGDPYTLVGDDPKSHAAIGFGVTGAPETFLIDQNGIIQHKQVGPLDEKVWNQDFLPIIKKLRQQ